MIVGDTNEFSKWLASDGMSWVPRKITTPYKTRQLSIRLPDTYLRMIALIDIVFQPFAGEQFKGAAIYVAEFDTGGEIASKMLFDRIRSLVSGREVDLAINDFTQFSATEYDDLYGLFLFAALGSWDAWLVARDCREVIRIHSAGFLEVDAENIAILDVLRERCKERSIVVRN
jgi:hypothetical protein